MPLKSTLDFRLPVALVGAVALNGCWEAETRLMPAADRDTPPIAGIYDRLPRGEGGRLTITPAEANQFDIMAMRTDNTGTQSFSSFDRLDLTSLEALPPTMQNSYIVESVPRTDPKNIQYTIMFIDSVNGAISELIHLQPMCSKATLAIIGKPDQTEKRCVFTSYNQVLTASLDAVQWLNDARFPPKVEVYVKAETN